VGYKNITILIALFVAALLLPALTQAEGVKELEQSIQKKKGTLSEVEKELKEKKKKIKRKWWEEKKITDSLDTIGRKLEGKKKELRTLDAEMKGLEKNVAHQEQEVARLEAGLAVLDEQFQSRVRAMYKLHRVGVVRILFSADDYSDALRRYKAFQLVAENDLRLLKTYQHGIDEKEKKRQALIKETRALERKRDAVGAKKKEIEGEKRKQAALLASVKKERAAYEKAVAELREREKALRALIQQLTVKAAALRSAGFKALRGKLPIPAQGDIFSPKGRERGIGIKAPEGTKIRAIFKGKVAYAGWFKGYGNLLIIDHGGGYHTVAAHASRLLKKVGDEVQTGEVVALVGSTASIEGPMLYFEIRYHGKAENPTTWLALAH
jgi:septal ring factor EnvC (AmiA/AmiB activator)